MNDNLNFANTNSLWGSFLVESLFRFGVRHAVISPGSRSAPLTYSLAVHPGIRAVPVLDERSASFFALGIAKRVRRPVVLVCTSGTAAANFFPAVIEARESGVPLLVLTADRPPEMRDCSSGQTIDQVKIFGQYPRWQAEVALPEPSEKLLAYLRQTAQYACERALGPVGGPVHLNLPFRDPLAPVPDESLGELDRERVANLLEELLPVEARELRPAEADVREVVERVERARRLVIVAGPALPPDPAAYAEAVAKLSGRAAAPVLADALSPVRQRGTNQPYLVDNYDFLLERGKAPEEPPDLVVRLGPLPTSKRLRRWLEGLNCPQLIVESSDQNRDPLHGRCVHIRTDLVPLVEETLPLMHNAAPSVAFVDRWIAAGKELKAEVDSALAECEELFEGKIAWMLGRHVPAGSSVFVSNSTPVRDVEFFWPPREEPVEIFFNRGANGIDGVLSAAMGVASEGRRTFLLTGDLAFLHDQNGLLNAKAVRGGLTVILINNNGGGIFRALPVAKFDPPFEEFFTTQQQVDFSAICGAHGIAHEIIPSWETFTAAVRKPCELGVRVLEVRTDPVADWERRQQLLSGRDAGFL